MKLQSIALLLLPTIVAANIAWRPAKVTQSSCQIQPAPSPQTSSISTASIAFTITSTTTSTPQIHAWDPIISQANHFLDGVNEHLHIDLRKRQGAVAATNTAATTVATQMPAVTTFVVGSVSAVYTQTFSATPDQWPSPQAGTIGLGTITGTVGIVKTNDKRDTRPEPTATPGHVLRIKGREITMS